MVRLDKLTYLAVTEQFHDAAFVRREPSNFADDGVDELALWRSDALAVARLGCLLDWGRGVALVRPDGEV